MQNYNFLLLPANYFQKYKPNPHLTFPKAVVLGLKFPWWFTCFRQVF